MDKKSTGRLMKDSKYKITLNEKQVFFYQKHPVIACEELLGIELNWFQRITLRIMWFCRFPMLNWGRGIGKTYMFAVFACLYAMIFPKTKIGIIAPVFRQANFVFDVIDTLYDDSPFLRHSMKKRPSRSAANTMAKFKNGSFIESLPVGDGTKVRGRRYNIVLNDEYAQMSDDIIKIVIRPMLNIKIKGRENKYIIGSTAYYKWNHYWTLYVYYSKQMAMGNSDYYISEYDFEDIPEDSPYNIDVEIINQQKETMTIDEFDMENRCRFPDSTFNFIPCYLIDECTPKAPKDIPIEVELFGDSKSEYILGIDVARVEGGDNFSIQVLKYKKESCSSLVHTVALNGATYPHMRDQIRQLFMVFPNILEIRVGAKGGGLTIKDLLAESWEDVITHKVYKPLYDMDDKNYENRTDGLRIIKMVQETAPTNNEMYNSFKSELEHHRLLFPINIRRDKDKDREKVCLEIIETKREIISVKAIPKGQYPEFVMPASSSGKKIRKDRLTALVIAVSGILERRRINYSEPVEEIEELDVGFFVKV